MKIDNDTPTATWSPDVLRRFAADFDPTLEKLLAKQTDIPTRLHEAMTYSLLAPGKRMRPYLTTRCCQLSGGTTDDAFAAAAAIECVHCFSLVHDDLPAMDDDDLRRGRPTTHKKFDEATAILVGDALLALAFEILATRSPKDADIGRMVQVLAESTGATGMIGGQAADLTGQEQPPSLKRTQYIHQRKTGHLFSAAARLGALAGNASDSAIDSMARFGLQLGLAFQIADDLLDLTATTEQMGKATSKDAVAGKQTYPACVGIEESQSAAKRASSEAIAALSTLGPDASDLQALARYAISRNY